jgi:hypothetical protein
LPGRSRWLCNRVGRECLVTGHDFSCANKANKVSRLYRLRKLGPEGDRVSPPPIKPTASVWDYRLGKNSQGWHEVSGRDFSRAVTAINQRGLQPPRGIFRGLRSKTGLFPQPV